MASFVQRVNTVGGLAPSIGCNSPADIGNDGVCALRSRLRVLYKSHRDSRCVRTQLGQRRERLVDRAVLPRSNHQPRERRTGFHPQFGLGDLRHSGSLSTPRGRAKRSRPCRRSSRRVMLPANECVTIGERRSFVPAAVRLFEERSSTRLSFEFGCRLPTESAHMARKTGKSNVTAPKAARTRRRRAAGLKAAATKRRKAVARKAATTRRRRSAGRKAAATKRRKAAARKAVVTRRRAVSGQTSDVVAVPIAVETFSADVLTTTVAGDEE